MLEVAPFKDESADKQLLPSNSGLVENEAIVDWGNIREYGWFIAEPHGETGDQQVSKKWPCGGVVEIILECTEHVRFPLWTFGAAEEVVSILDFMGICWACRKMDWLACIPAHYIKCST